MTYRFYITIGSSQTEVHPLNFLKTSLQDTMDDDVIFYRRKFSGTLRFISDDYDLIYMVEQVDPCTELILTIEQRDSGAATYHTYWTGYFTTMDGRFDLDNCFFEVTPKPYDSYKDMDENWEDEYNILNEMSAVKVSTWTDYPLEEYKENYFITDVIEHLLQKFAPAATLTSFFLQNATNPVLGGVNQYQYLTIAQKSDIKRPNATNPATIGMMSLKRILEMLRMYNLFWTFDGSVLRIEHYDFWTSADGLDLRTQSLAQKSNKYSYLKDRMPKYEKFTFAESKDGNFTEHIISYSSPCVSESTALAIPVTTDLSYIIQSMSTAGMEGNIADEGWVILANSYDGADYHVYYGAAYASPNSVYNYVNSWAYVLRAFWMHGRVLLSGFINGVPYDFISVRKTKEQEVNAIVCYEDGYDPNDAITTELGETYFGGLKGQVKQATIYPDGRVNFNLLYGEDRNTEVVLPIRTKNLRIIIDTSSYTEIVSILSEPNIYDTYYWILWNDSVVGEVCQEIMIPAGTTYQEDLSDLTEPFASIKFNYSDASLSGWTITYNDNAPMTATIDCPAVPPVPPAPPAATTMIGAGQTSDCAPVHVSWNASATATYYVLYRKPDFGLADNWVVIDSTVNTYYDDVNQCDQVGVMMTYKVKACNIAGCSADSDETSHEIICL